MYSGERDMHGHDAPIRAIELQIRALMDAEPEYIRWYYSEQGLPHDIVAGQMDVGVLTVGADYKLSIAWWLDRESYASGPRGYSVRNLEQGPMLQWSGYATGVEDVRAVDIKTLKPVEVPDVAGRLAAFGELLPQGTPVDSDILQTPEDTIHRRPSFRATIEHMCRRMIELPPELFG